MGAVNNIGNVQERLAQQLNNQTLIGLTDLTKGFSDTVETELFWDVWEIVQEKFVEGPQDERSLFYGAIEGAVASLEDPYSVFLRPEITKEFVADLSGSFEGIGAEIGKRQGRLIIVAPLPNSPAEKAGLESGDIVATIDGEDAGPLPLDEAVRRIRGPRGSAVQFTIFREKTDELLDISVTRAPIDIPTVSHEVREDGVLYVKLSHFNDVSLKKFDPVIKAANKDSVKGMVLDLRNNPGGFLDVAVAMTSEWLAEGELIVKEDFHNGGDHDIEYTSRGNHRLTDVPTVVLINGGSASASEILAGALRDHDKAILVGETTFGKGSVQDFQTFPDGSALKLTVAKWLTPKGGSINDTGIEADVTVTGESEIDVELDDIGDPILDKGIEVLLELVGESLSE